MIDFLLIASSPCGTCARIGRHVAKQFNVCASKQEFWVILSEFYPWFSSQICQFSECNVRASTGHTRNVRSAVEAVLLKWLAASSMAWGRRHRFWIYRYYFTSYIIVPCLWHFQVSLQVAVNMREWKRVNTWLCQSTSALSGVEAAQEKRRLGPPLQMIQACILKCMPKDILQLGAPALRHLQHELRAAYRPQRQLQCLSGRDALGSKRPQRS